MWKNLLTLCFAVTLLSGCNSSTNDVEVWLTLGNVEGFVTDVNGIFGIAESGLQGSFTLKAGEELEYTSDKGLSGNISFGTAPINCPTSTYANGVNIFEFCLNNSSQAGTPQETIDISAIAGVHSLLKATLSGGGEWNAGTAHTGIASFENAALYSNTGLVGVFPYGCDNCTSSDAPPSCPGHPAYETPQSEPICNIQRDATNSGGTVTVEFIDFI
jgi:hypothetical protein